MAGWARAELWAVLPDLVLVKNPLAFARWHLGELEGRRPALRGDRSARLPGRWLAPFPPGTPCQQGCSSSRTRGRALSEMRRALKPGGRAGVSVWCAIDQCPPFEALAIALGDVLGREMELAYRGGPWGLTDPDELAPLFVEAGFTDVRVARRTLPIVFDGGPPQLMASLAATTVGPQVAALDETGRGDLLAATARALAPLVHDGAVHSELASHVVLGRF